MEVRYPEGDAVLVYDGERTTPERVVKALHDLLPGVEVFIKVDRPLP
ncbi:MAG: hypothetical protein HY663_03815 [Chloroflexi bacterium]|nr:hypothetical protein [Chloroflexota bacterium]